MTYSNIFKKVFLVITFLLSCIAPSAQVMWNIKGGAMPIKERHFDESKEKTKLNWMAGLEIEIPLSKKFNIETGLRYRRETFCKKVEEDECEDFENHLELPIRLAYKQRLGDKFSLHAGIGPYIGAPLHDELIPQNLGIEASVAVNWKCLSLGVTYNKICFNTGSFNKERDNKYKANSGLMLTLGFRFGSRAWKYVGAGLLAAGAVAGTVYAATQGDNSGGNYSPDINNSSSSSDYSTSNSSNKNTDSKICSACKGSGICRFCKGSGQSHEEIALTNKHKRCDKCKGSKRCHVCNGKKIIGTTQKRNSDIIGTCRECNGSTKCAECNGDGWNYSGGEPVLCWRCKGDRKCKSCNGTGKH